MNGHANILRIKRKLVYSIAVCAALTGCAATSGPGRASVLSHRQAVAHETRTYVLGKIPDQDRERAFQELLDSAQAQAEKNRGGSRPPDTGFSYSMTPIGAVYPFSEVEVSCLVQASQAAGRAGKLCSDFFGTLDSGIGNIAAPR